MDPRLDWQRVHAILDLVQDDEVIDSLQTREESDVVHHSEHDSDTDAELLTDIDDDYVDCKNGYRTKDGRVLSKTSKSLNATYNVKKQLETKKRKRDIKHCPSPKFAWQMFFSEDILEQIVESTNENLRKCKNAFTTNINEIKALIGILYYHGIVRSSYQKRSDLFDDQLGIAFIRNAMTLERYELLLKNLRFEKEQTENILEYDTMKQMRKVFEIFAHNCRTVMEIENTVVIDESIVPVYGPCPFKYNIERKNISSGFKLITLLDPENFYVCNLDIVNDTYYAPDEIVKKLVKNLSGSGCTVIMDSWYTSIPLFEKLLNECNIYSIGAINPKDDIIPPIFHTRHRPLRTFMTAFLNKDTILTSYINTDQKIVTVLTNHPRYYKKTNVHHVSAISAYKKKQSAVEVLDVLTHYYTTMQYSNSWALSLFFTLLNIAAVNTQVVWSHQNPSMHLQRRTFIQGLALELVTDYSNETEINDTESKLGPRAKRNYYINPDSINRRQRCSICIRTTKRDRKTRCHCCKCGAAICREHQAHLCTYCVRV